MYCALNLNRSPFSYRPWLFIITVCIFGAEHFLYCCATHIVGLLRLSHDIRHHNTAIWYLSTCFLRVGVLKYTVWEPLTLHTHSDLCELSVLPWPCKADVLQTDVEVQRMKISSDDTFVWESTVFVIPSISPAGTSGCWRLGVYLAQDAGECSFSQQLFFPWPYKSRSELCTQHKWNVYNRKMEFNSCSHSDINILICSFNSALLLKLHISIMSQFCNTWGSPADLYTNSCKSHSCAALCGHFILEWLKICLNMIERNV